MTASPLLEIEGLVVRPAGGLPGRAQLVRGIDLVVHRGEAVGIVGESGSGKSLTCRSVLGIIPSGLEARADRLEFDGIDLAALAEGGRRRGAGRREERGWADVRGRRIGAVFQDPGSYLNPSITVGRQLAEVLRVRLGRTRRAAREETIGLLARLGLRDPARVATRYPHELSGGMLQRVLLAIALAEGPDLLIADEPTTALDATVQAEVLDVLADLRERQGLALLFVSHDLAVVAQVCDRIAVMQRGLIVEEGRTRDVLDSPQHPYTRALIAAHAQYALPGVVGGAGAGAHDGSAHTPQREAARV